MPRPEPEPRQRVEKTGRRRARLTPVEGTDTSPEKPVESDEPARPQNAREAEMLRDKPPHWK
ncbi:MAG: hypothetical protein ACOYBP_01005 [Microbacteriaceae bacterium]